MSLMNDALRKKKREKQPAGGAVLQRDTAENNRRQKRRRGFSVVAVVTACMAAGYFFLEYRSLSKPSGLNVSLISSAAIPVPARETRRLPNNGGNIPTAVDAPPPLPAADLPPSNSGISTETTPPPGAAGTADDSVEPPVASASPPPPAAFSSETADAAPASKAAVTHRKPSAAAAGTDTVNHRPPDPPEGQPVPDLSKSKQRRPPPNPSENPFYLKAISYHRRGDLEKAAAMYATVLRQHPQHFASCFNLASVYLALGAYSRAHPLLTELHTAKPENPAVAVNLAVSLLGMNQADEAAALLDRMQHRPDAPAFEIFFHKGVAAAQKRDDEKALFWYGKARAIKPLDPHLLLNSGLAHDRLKQYRAAVNCYQEYVDRQADIGDNAEVRAIQRRIRQLTAYLKVHPAGAASGPQLE